MLELFERLLKTVPFSAESPGFVSLVIRAVRSTETALAEHDLRLQPLEAAELIEVARKHLHRDSAYEVRTHYDLWVCDAASGRWQLRPQPLEIICNGEEYDEGGYSEVGHFQADIGFEHLFTGHAGLLGGHTQSVAAPQHPAEAQFLTTMANPENFREYHARTCENIRKLLDWMGQAQAALPVERCSLWSEGEENFEVRLDDILAAR